MPQIRKPVVVYMEGIQRVSVAVNIISNRQMPHPIRTHLLVVDMLDIGRRNRSRLLMWKGSSNKMLPIIKYVEIRQTTSSSEKR